MSRCNSVFFFGMTVKWHVENLCRFFSIRAKQGILLICALFWRCHFFEWLQYIYSIYDRSSRRLKIKVASHCEITLSSFTWKTPCTGLYRSFRLRSLLIIGYRYLKVKFVTFDYCLFLAIVRLSVLCCRGSRAAITESTRPSEPQACGCGGWRSACAIRWARRPARGGVSPRRTEARIAPTSAAPARAAAAARAPAEGAPTTAGRLLRGGGELSMCFSKLNYLIFCKILSELIVAQKEYLSLTIRLSINKKGAFEVY